MQPLGSPAIIDLFEAQPHILVGVLQLVLLAAALIDIRRRDANAINGSKWLWTLVVLINFIGH